jgi:magnesium-transporting ATPase (P-type)
MPSPPQTDWHARPHEEAFEAFESSPHDLAEEVAAARLATHGPNRIEARAGRGPLLRFALQFHQPLIYILIVSGAVAAFLGEWADAGVIFGVVMVNALIGFIQEGRAEDALAALARSVASDVTVLRGGQQRRIDAVTLVPGDVVRLAAGDKVPADLRLFDARALQLTEAALTGESTSVAKHTGVVASDSGLAERANLAFAGTLVVGGQGGGLVVATGRATETGRIADLLDATETLATPLTRAMARFSNYLLVLILGLAVVGFVVGSLRGEPLVDMLMAAVALAVGAIPEGLPAAITVTLAIGVARMARRRAIIRRLPAVETLGSTTVICSDKTGTLTENQMTVRALLAGGQRFAVSGDGYAPEGVVTRDGARPRRRPLRELLVAGVLCNDAGLAEQDGVWASPATRPRPRCWWPPARPGSTSTRCASRAAPRRDRLRLGAPVHGLPQPAGRPPRGAAEGRAGGHPARCTHARWRRRARAGRYRRRRQPGRAMARMACACWPSRGRGGRASTPLAGGLCFLGLQAMLDPPRQAALRAIQLRRGRRRRQDDHRRPRRHGAGHRPRAGPRRRGRRCSPAASWPPSTTRRCARGARWTSSPGSSRSRSCASSRPCRPTARWWR